MSHYTVTVRLTEERLKASRNQVKKALDIILAPFDEATKEPAFLEFENVEEEYRGKYETETSRMVKCPDGKIISPYDEHFRVPGTFGTTYGGKPEHRSHRIPQGYEEFDQPHKEAYKTFEVFCEEYGGYKFDPVKKAYGYWSNPNAKWDWWEIGGRWTGYYPLKKGTAARHGRPGVMTKGAPETHGDIVYIQDIDMAAVAKAEVEAAEKYWADWQAYLEGKKFDAFYGPRERAMDIGLLEVIQAPVEPKSGQRVMSWDKLVPPDDDRRTWSDVIKLVTRDEFFREYLIYFDELSTYAALDDNGWTEPGKMGWFGCSRATPVTRSEYLTNFRPRMIDACSPKDMLVVVDCHI